MTNVMYFADCVIKFTSDVIHCYNGLSLESTKNVWKEDCIISLIVLSFQISVAYCSYLYAKKKGEIRTPVSI